MLPINCSHNDNINSDFNILFVIDTSFSMKALDYNGNKEIVEKEIKYIQDYLKINVFKTSIMSPAEKKIVGIISPIKRLTTHMLLGGNIVGALRDSLEGV